MFRNERIQVKYRPTNRLIITVIAYSAAVFFKYILTTNRTALKRACGTLFVLVTGGQINANTEKRRK